LTELLLGRLSPGRLSVGVAAGVITLVVILVLVAMALPFGCATGLSWDGSCAAKAVSPVHAVPLPKVQPTAAAPIQKPAPIAPQAPAVAQPLQNLVAATFQTLHVPPGPVAVEPGMAPAAQGKLQPDQFIAKNTDANGSGLGTMKRTVQTIAVGPDGAIAPASTGTDPAPQAQPAPVQAVAAVPQATAAAPVQLAPLPAADAVAAPATPVPLPTPARASEVAKTASIAAPAKAAPMKAAPMKATDVQSAMLVGGSGVTVRSGPGKANAQVFPLAAGQRVTVTGIQKGWLHITDAQGRAGWAYSAYFKAGK
jgi:hypothetical protein